MTARLIDPTTSLRSSFLAAAAEFRADRDFRVPWYVTDIDADALVDPDAFTTYVERVLAERLETGIRPGFVPMTTLWWADGDEFIGRLAIRLRLTPALSETGGHIGYDVRPSARRQGHATAILAAALPVARSLGLIELLLMVDDTNTASRRVIETNGGRYIDQVADKLRYRFTQP